MTKVEYRSDFELKNDKSEYRSDFELKNDKDKI